MSGSRGLMPRKAAGRHKNLPPLAHEEGVVRLERREVTDIRNDELPLQRRADLAEELLRPLRHVDAPRLDAQDAESSWLEELPDVLQENLHLGALGDVLVEEVRAQHPVRVPLRMVGIGEDRVHVLPLLREEHQFPADSWSGFDGEDDAFRPDDVADVRYRCPGRSPEVQDQCAFLQAQLVQAIEHRSGEFAPLRIPGAALSGVGADELLPVDRGAGDEVPGDHEPALSQPQTEDARECGAFRLHAARSVCRLKKMSIRRPMCWAMTYVTVLKGSSFHPHRWPYEKIRDTTGV